MNAAHPARQQARTQAKAQAAVPSLAPIPVFRFLQTNRQPEAQATKVLNRLIDLAMINKPIAHHLLTKEREINRTLIPNERKMKEVIEAE